MSFYITLLGAPGSGKGTQTEKLSKHFKLPVIGIGNIIRSEIKSGSELGRSVQRLVSTGGLVSDEVIVDLFERSVTDSLYETGVIMDGYPRTLVQAKSFKKVFFSKNLPVKVIYLDTSLEVIMERLLGRQICEGCSSVFHKKFSPSLIENICDNCSGNLIERDDDTEESIRNRYEVFLNETMPILDYFSDIIQRVDANAFPDNVFSQLVSALK